MKPRIFVASSVEHLDLAYAVQENLEHEAEVTVWSQGVFRLSRSTMASLVDQLDETDFGVFILSPDDVTTMRGTTNSTIRDNIIFELGLFAGRLGPERCYLIVPRDADNLHLPSDLIGLTPALFDSDRQDRNMVAALGPACNRIRKSMKQLGVLEKEIVSAESPSGGEDVLCSDPNDCISLIQSWMGGRPASMNTKAIRYAEVDSELGLVPGSARLFLEEAGKAYGYVADRKGNETILLKKEDRQYSSGFY